MPGVVSEYVNNRRLEEDRNLRDVITQEQEPVLSRMRELHEPAIVSAEKILGYANRTPEARERIDFALDNERGRLKDNGLDPVEAWTVAANNLARRLDHDGYEKPLERAVKSRTRAQRDEMELSL